MAALVCRNCFGVCFVAVFLGRKIRSTRLIPFCPWEAISSHWCLPHPSIRLLASVHSRQQTLLVQVAEFATAAKKVAPYKGFSLINRHLACRFQRTFFNLLRFGHETAPKFFFKSALFSSSKAAKNPQKRPSQQLFQP